MTTGPASDPLSAAARLACSRIDNFKSALDWVARQLSDDPSYEQTFRSVASLLAQRRHAVGREPAPRAHSQVHFCAIGKSGDVARLLVSMLTSVGIRASFLHPTEALHGDIGQVGPDDAVILISYRGESSELLEIVPLLKSRCESLTALTAFAEAPLARAADRVLALPTVREMSAHDHAPVTSTVVALALGQLLVAATMDDDQLDLESYALNHPGGAIGRRIFTKVDDIMTSFGGLPLVEPQARFEKVISTMTERAFGVAFVTEGHRLAGIITEKDLREAMKRWGPAIFEAAAESYMNTKPITVPPGTLAVAALRLMEGRERPLNFLPVVAPSGEAVGLVRLHDLIKAGIRL